MNPFFLATIASFLFQSSLCVYTGPVDPEIARMHQAAASDSTGRHQINPAFQKLPEDIQREITKKALRENARDQVIKERRSHRKELKKQGKFTPEDKKAAALWNRDRQRRAAQGGAEYGVPIYAMDAFDKKITRNDLKHFNKDNKKYQRK